MAAIVKDMTRAKRRETKVIKASAKARKKGFNRQRQFILDELAAQEADRQVNRVFVRR